MSPAQSSQSLLQFSHILDAQLDHSLPYSSMKHLLRAVKSVHPQYPRRTQRPKGASQVCSLSQTQIHADDHPDDTASIVVTASDTPAEQTPQPSPARRELPARPANGQLAKRERGRRSERRKSLQTKQLDCEENVAQNGSLSQRSKRRRVINVPSAYQAGQAINCVLVKMAESDDNTDGVKWGQLREKLVHMSGVYMQFCKSMDKLFDATDPLSTFGVSELSQSRRQCVFYSNLFWEGAWRDYWRSSQNFMA